MGREKGKRANEPMGDKEGVKRGLLAWLMAWPEGWGVEGTRGMRSWDKGGS